MPQVIGFIVRVILLAIIWFIGWWALSAPLSKSMDLAIIVGGVLLTFPVVWLGRKVLDKQPDAIRAVWVTTFVHFSPTLLFFVKVYEERELEIRFGPSYQDYKARTPMLFPKKPGGRTERG